MACRVYADTWTYETVISDSDVSLVKDSEIEVSKKPLSDRNLLAIVAIERLIDNDFIVGYMTKEPFQYPQPAFAVSRTKMVVVIYDFLHRIDFLQQLPIHS